MDDFYNEYDDSRRRERREAYARGGGGHHQNRRIDPNRDGRGRGNWRGGQRNRGNTTAGRGAGVRNVHDGLRRSVEQLHQPRNESNQRHERDRRGADHENGRHNGHGRDHLRRSVEQLDQPRGGSNEGPRPKRTMGFQFLQKLVENNDIQQVMLDLSNDRNGFDRLLDIKEMSNDMVVLLAKLLRNVCRSTFHDTKITLLSAALRSQFIGKLTVFITGIMHQSERDRRFNKHFWNDPDDFWQSLLKLSKTVHDLIPTRCEPIKLVLSNMSIFIPMIEAAHAIHISDSIKEETNSLKDIVEKTIKDLEVKKERLQQRNPFKEELEPPNDFREIEIIPSAQEVVSDLSPFLRENIIDRPFRDVQQYLDIQFRLLREDFVAPLRRGINTFLNNQNRPKNEWKKLDDIKIYNQIRFLHAETLNDCNCYMIKFDFSKKKRVFKYENSKRFMFGSLVCFTSDNFKSLLFGKIVQRDVKLLEQGMLIVGFQNEVQVSFEQDYLMVESSVYFEPYYHVLGVLKRMDPDTFPMERYIIRVETDTRPPQYLTDDPMYEVQGVRFSPPNIPPRRFYNFNDSQFAAFKAALFDEFSIIQGPPGTGKTYLGLKIAHVLLHNRHAWYDKTPILVICYTNHALDQFLEGILPATENILRIGGQSKNEALAKFNLAVKRRTVKVQAAAVHQKRREVRTYMQELKTLSDTLNHIEANEGVVSFECFKGIIEDYDSTWFATAKSEQIKKWLLQGKVQDQRAIPERNHHREIEAGMRDLLMSDDNEEDELPEDVNDDDQRNIDDLDDVFSGIEVRGYRPLLTVQQLRDKLQTLNQEKEALSQQQLMLDDILRQEAVDRELWETQTDLDYLLFQLNLYEDNQNRRPVYTDLRSPHTMLYDDRWRLYFSLLEQYIRQLRQTYAEINDKFREVYRVYNEMRNMEDTQLMRESLVVGLTTTGAARLQSSLQALQSPIVIVEEAAEVLEAHIVASLTNHCQHLILIGDHLQLKPGAADYRIETKYKLGISLFERMVRNKIKCHTLNVQHRMRPEISSLIKPHIYPDLEDHESTLQRSPILGVEKSLFFINHQVEEERCEDASKKNKHESTFLIAFARHLILNGYKPDQITILAAYLGQYFEMVREKKKSENAMLLQDVRISVLDNYQGEECDIILLSLVRSNTENKAGFLRIQNRVCVALSRARNGFYIMGNMSLLLNANSENQIWEKVKAVLDEQEAIGPHLTLICQVHHYKYTKVSEARDFVKLSEGGCDMLCGAALVCGHTCRRLCHVQDRDHKLYRCNEKCTKLLCDDPTHVCLKRCYEDCGPCTHLVWRYLDCGHRARIECHIDPAKYDCMELVRTRLPCDHETNKPCFIDPNRFRCPFPCDSRVEPCGHACSRQCHIRVDPDHLEYKCQKPCAKPRVGCKQTDDPHLCTMLCYKDCEECNVSVKKTRFCGHVFNIACKLDINEQLCEKPCKKVLACKHKCKGTCSAICPPCEYMVEKTIPDCQHAVKIKCHQEPERKLCKSKKCPRLLPCGHRCTRPCKEPCTAQCEEIVDCAIRSPCGHVVKKIMCYLKGTGDPDTILKNCSEPCGTQLKCKHICRGTCGECIQSRIHKRCQEKCGVPLVCNHECPIPCREACKPCTLPCGIKCRHSKCRKKCGEPCTPCTNGCPRRCAHVHCTRRCGEICNVPPCSERCPKLLKCEHPCVGFCGDPCPPLCRICNEEELTEIFFGTEDDEDAIFVLLKDCNHVLESTGLQEWLEQGEDRIQFKTCPKCKTNIATTERYSDYIKRAVNDVILAKKKSFGEPEENKALRTELVKQLDQLNLSSFILSNGECVKLATAIGAFATRLEPSRNDRRQTVSKIELNAIQSKLQTLSYIIKCFSENKKKFVSTDQSSKQLNMLLDTLMRSEDHVTNQEIEDLEFEIKRLHRIVQFENVKKSSNFNYAMTQPGIAFVAKNLEGSIFIKRRYTDKLDDAVKSQLEYLVSKVDSAMIISDKERMEIVQAIGLSKGHWYKCPNGHPYAIGECGGANQIARCFCGERIGGTDHHLLPTNQFAGEMDGAERHAWPGGLY